MMIRILLADDEPSVLSALRLLLEQESDVRVAGEVTNSDALQEWLTGNKVDMVLLDWKLPGKPVAELIPLLHAATPMLQIIVLDSSPQTRRVAISAGADNFVSKVEPSEPLLAVLESTRRILNASDAKQTKNYSGYYTRDFNIGDFTKVHVGAAIKVTIDYSSAYLVAVSNDEYDRIKIEKNGDILSINRRGIDWLFMFRSQPEVRIEMPDLQELVMSGASQGRAAKFFSDHSLAIEVTGASHLNINDITAGDTRIKISGAGHITGNLKCGDIDIEVNGASWATMSGTAKTMSLEVNGASHAELEEFRVERVKAGIQGASHGSINTDGRLDAHIHGASHLSWVGHPEMGDIDVSGASHIQRR